MKKKGKFIVLEGIDGAGKTTLGMGLCQKIRELGKTCSLFHEPTQFDTGQRLRAYLRGEFSLDSEEELELFIHDRRESVSKNIQPSLESQDFTLLDRYIYSSAAYQWKSGKTPEEIYERNRREGFPLPDWVVYLEIPVDLALERIQKNGRKQERFESKKELELIQERYEKVLPPNTIRMDSRKSPQELVNSILNPFQKSKNLVQRRKEKAIISPCPVHFTRESRIFFFVL